MKRVDGGADGNTGAGNDTATERWRCLGKPRRKLKPGATVEFEGVSGLVLEADGDGLTVELSAPKGLRNVLSQHGRIPLPPYIRRADDSADHERYQTIFAGASEGSVAAPTAGLHFTDEVLSALEAAGHRHTSVTLHVGPGTFLPVRVESLEEHTMHGEWIDVSDEVVGEIEDARRDGRQIIAVGTTVVRALESAAAQVGGFGPLRGETELFIVPGHEFRIVQGLITNFHLPKSTLLALVSAFAGRDLVLEAYRQAVRREYRFYSYGDAMLIQ